MKIRTRIFLCFFIIVAAGFYYLVDWFLDGLRPRYLEAVEESMVDTATILSSFVVESSREAGGGRMEIRSLRDAMDSAAKSRFEAKIYELKKDRMDLRVYITDDQGIVIFDSDGGKDEGEDYSEWNDVYLTLRGRYGARSTRDDQDDEKSSVLYVASPIVLNDVTVGVLAVCKPTKNAVLFMESAKERIIAAGTLAGLAVILLGILTSAWVTRPIQILTTYAREVRDGKNVRLPELGGSEIGEMGRAFEEMRVSLEGKDYIEKYVETLTHELKGPLTAIKGAAELMEEDMPSEQRAKFLNNIQAETGRIQKVVDRMLLLSSLESRRGLRDVEIIPLGELIREIEKLLEPILASRKILLVKSVSEEVTVKGERFLIKHAIINLLQNAVDFSYEDDEVEISLIRNPDGQASLEIADSGPGIPEYALGRVFDRFYSLKRPANGRKGSGLGLAFVKEVADLHGGSITLMNRPRGGAAATLLIPAIPS